LRLASASFGVRRLSVIVRLLGIFLLLSVVGFAQ